MVRYLRVTAMLNFSAKEIQGLISDRQWKSAGEYNQTPNELQYRKNKKTRMI